MSGRKQIMIDQAELRKLQQAADRLRTVDANLPNVIEGIRRQAEADLQRGMNQVRDRQAGFDKRIKSMRDEVRKVERNTSERIRKQAEEMANLESRHREEHDGLHQRLNSSVHRLDEAIGQTRRDLKAQGDALRGEIAQEREVREREMADVNARIKRIEDNEQEARRVAGEWMHDADTMYDAIRDMLPHEQYFPGELENIRQDLQGAKDELSQGFGQSALSSVTKVFRRLSGFRRDIETRDAERRLAQQAVSEAVRMVGGLVDENRMLRVAFEHDEIVQIAEGQESQYGEVLDLDVNKWTDGALAQLKADAEALERRIMDDQEPMSTEELEALFEGAILDLNTRLQETMQRAGAKMSEHRMRLSIADAVGDVLTQNFYHVADGGWAANDELKEFTAKFVDDAKNEIVLIVSNDNVEVNSYDRTSQAARLREGRTQQLAQALQKMGIRVSTPTEINPAPDEGLRDVGALVRDGVDQHRQQTTIEQTVQQKATSQG